MTGINLQAITSFKSLERTFIGTIQVPPEEKNWEFGIHRAKSKKNLVKILEVQGYEVELWTDNVYLPWRIEVRYINKCSETYNFKDKTQWEKVLSEISGFPGILVVSNE